MFDLWNQILSCYPPRLNSWQRTRLIKVGVTDIPRGGQGAVKVVEKGLINYAGKIVAERPLTGDLLYWRPCSYPCQGHLFTAPAALFMLPVFWERIDLLGWRNVGRPHNQISWNFLKGEVISNKKEKNTHAVIFFSLNTRRDVWRYFYQWNDQRLQRDRSSKMLIVLSFAHPCVILILYDFILQNTN